MFPSVVFGAENPPCAQIDCEVGGPRGCRFTTFFGQSLGKPTWRTQDPSFGIQDPGSNFEDPGSNLEDPGSNIEDPGSKFELKQNKTQQNITYSKANHKRSLVLVFTVLYI